MIWYLKQLLPLRYHTHYKQNGYWHVVDWRMWFGKSFAVDDVKLT